MLTTHTVEMCITTLTNHKQKIERKKKGNDKLDAIEFTSLFMVFFF